MRRGQGGQTISRCSHVMLAKWNASENSQFGSRGRVPCVWIWLLPCTFTAAGGVFMNPSRSLPSMSANSLDSSLLMRLPPETLDEIASYIDLHRDLVSLACASHACSKLVFPRHIQYRVIRVRFCTPLLWAHLARRADLSRNIREVHICDRQDFTSSDRYPTKLIDKQVDGAQHNFTIEEAMNNLCRALRNMKNLHTFTWTCLEEVSPLLPLHKPHLEDKFLAALRECPRLEHLALQGLFARFARINTYPVSWTPSPMARLFISLTRGNFFSVMVHVQPFVSHPERMCVGEENQCSWHPPAYLSVP